MPTDWKVEPDLPPYAELTLIECSSFGDPSLPVLPVLENPTEETKP